MAAEDQSTELLPLLDSDEPYFDVTMRGYDKRQVDDYVARTAAQLAELAAARDAALATSADRAAQLASREAHIESLRVQAARKTETLDPAAVSDRIRDMLQLATDEAAQTRRAAEVEAERVLSSARADAERMRAEAAAEQQRLTASAAQRSAEADQKLAQARTTAIAELDKARAEATRLLEAARAERDRADAQSAAARTAADAESARRRQLAEEDFEITLRARRSEAERQHAADHQAAQATAEKLVNDAKARVVELAEYREQTFRTLRELHDRLGADIAATPGPGPNCQASRRPGRRRPGLRSPRPSRSSSYRGNRPPPSCPVRPRPSCPARPRPNRLLRLRPSCPARPRPSSPAPRPAIRRPRWWPRCRTGWRHRGAGSPPIPRSGWG
ncbi:MAG TPA: DivIVA domain-containing protein [Jatrophihabitans sp.]|nr:DivIVA domain-containing protein [Jatrophihabitans sp.]